MVGIGEGEGLGVGFGFGFGLASETEKQKLPQPQEQKRQDVPISQNQPTKVKSNPAPMISQGQPQPVVETIGQHFMGDLSIASLSDYNLDDDVTWSADDRDDLNDCIIEAVGARSSRQYCGLKTNASLMGDAMKLMLEMYEKKVPPPWLPVMNMLREAASPPKKAQPRTAPPVKRLTPMPWHIAHGYERCSDEIWRPKEARDAEGYTVREEYNGGGVSEPKMYNLWRKK